VEDDQPCHRFIRRSVKLKGHDPQPENNAGLRSKIFITCNSPKKRSKKL
jgi:hypothetical protein